MYIPLAGLALLALAIVKFIPDGMEFQEQAGGEQPHPGPAGAGRHGALVLDRLPAEWARDLTGVELIEHHLVAVAVLDDDLGNVRRGFL